MTTLKKIEAARNPAFKALGQTQITARINAIMAGPKHPGTIISMDAKACLTLAQLYIEYSLNNTNLADAADYAEDALAMA